MILNDLDPGGAHPFPAPQSGQVVGDVLIEGSRKIVWARGGEKEQHDITFWAQAWQGAGGQGASSYLALRYLLRQLEELAKNADMQPAHIQFAGTAQSGQYNVSTPHDGWYVIESLQPAYDAFVVSGLVQVKATITLVSPSLPSALRMLYEGTALSSTYSTAAINLVAFPLGATAPPTSWSRTGAEGTVPLAVISASGPNPSPFVPSATLANLWSAGVRCFDTVTAGGNAVPTGGAAANATWVQVYGLLHDLTGDLVLSNGLLLLRVNQAGTTDVWCWNTQLSTQAWQQVGVARYVDSGGNVGTVRSIDLEMVGLRRTRATVLLSTSAGNWARMSWELDAGHYAAAVDFMPLTEANTSNQGLDLNLSTAVHLVANESTAYDVATQGAGSLAPTSGAGWSVAIGTTANQLLCGIAWQNPPNSAQPRAVSTTDLGFGETTGPSQGSFRTYAIWAAPYVTSPNLLAEAESGTLGTGWSSVADAGSSGGNAAKCASGTASTNADLWATSFIPTAGVYDVWVRLRVASVASSTSQMQIGLWDATSSAFVSSTTYAPNAAGLSTSYVWVRVAASVTPTATHNMRVRAVTTATTTTDWFIDQSALVPIGTSGDTGNLPRDVWKQFLGRRRIRLVRG